MVSEESALELEMNEKIKLESWIIVNTNPKNSNMNVGNNAWYRWKYRPEYDWHTHSMAMNAGYKTGKWQPNIHQGMLLIAISNFNNTHFQLLHSPNLIT